MECQRRNLLVDIWVYRSPVAFVFAHEPAYSGHSAREIVWLCGLQRLLLTGRAQQSTFHQYAMERLKIAFRFNDAPADECLFKPLCCGKRPEQPLRLSPLPPATEQLDRTTCAAGFREH